ncbi:MAG: 3-hydroxyacyl-ACP dehydratase FabZ [Acidobacteriia bacterium]|nr:3-hydroxyacyl-ACP dehydratase FabZ [Terriglobia bacterium]
MEGTFSALKIREILEIMPHRYPFLLVDRIIEFDGKNRMVGIKNVSFNEAFFQGHFPEHPVMPGVLVVEALAQVGVILLFSADESRNSKLVYFSGIDNCRFRQPVIPGDQIRLEVTSIKRRGNFFKMKGEALVDGTLVAEAELSCAIVDRG